VAYYWQPSDSFHALIGLPFVVQWRPIPDLTLDFSYMLLTTVHARATYRLCPWARVYLAYAWENEGYFLVDRPDPNDRLIYVDQNIRGGVQLLFGPHAQLDLAAGYVFDRYYFEGRNITSGTSFNRIDLGDGALLSAQLLVRW
jgi:hypothetical protein